MKKEFNLDLNNNKDAEFLIPLLRLFQIVGPLYANDILNLLVLDLGIWYRGTWPGKVITSYIIFCN